MRELKTEIEIQASAEKVWELLTDFNGFPEWNPFIRSIDGRLITGERLKVYLQPSGARGMTFRPRVLKVEPPKEFRWLGHLLMPGLFDGEHIFTVESLAIDKVRFVQREVFQGILVRLFSRRLDTETRRGFEEMNLALKNLTENIE